MASSHTRARAKPGDPQAIEGLLNRSLHPQGITATVRPSQAGLQIHLRSPHTQDPSSLLTSIHRGTTLYSHHRAKGVHSEFRIADILCPFLGDRVSIHLIDYT